MPGPTKIKIGDAVIINDVDAPTARNVAIVRKIETSGKVRARYLSSRVAKSYGQKDCYSADGATHLRDFGRELMFALDEGGEIFEFTTRSSGNEVVATYRDDEPRRWQEESSPYIKVDRKNPMLKLLRS